MNLLSFEEPNLFPIDDHGHVTAEPVGHIVEINLYKMLGKPEPIGMTVDLARAQLFDAGLNEDQLSIVTGFGHRSGVACKPDDTILNKYAAGALLIVGVMGSVFGSGSPQHHRGHAWNPRWFAYCRASGNTPTKQIAIDATEWPGGHNTGFILWMHEQREAFLRSMPKDDWPTSTEELESRYDEFLNGLAVAA